MSVGAEIKRRRENVGITQEDLARVVCVSRSAIAQYENGYKLPSIEVLFRIADALETTPTAILKAAQRAEVKS
ncbi:MAG: helix-turn-helix transcriptional regulator [Clostridia bacterium]|nr:helix-turn-helix transcriptional regulator [Clostridia bacterium]